MRNKTDTLIHNLQSTVRGGCMKSVTAKKSASKRSQAKLMPAEDTLAQTPSLLNKNNGANFGKVVAMFADNFGSVLLIFAAFLIGMLFTEVRYLKKTSQPAPAQVAQAPQPQEPEAVPLTDKVWKELINTKPAFEMGDKNAKVTIVEFTDYQCPFCARFFQQSHKAIVDEYIKTNKARLMVFDYPLGFHPNAKPASEFARCAGEQGKYEAIHDALFAQQDAWANLSGEALTAKFEDMLKSAGGNTASAIACLKEGRYSKAVDESFALGGKVGVSGTPSFIINKELVVGAQPTAVFKSAIDKNL